MTALQLLTLWKPKALSFSREAAKECSPQRKLWVAIEKCASPGGAKDFRTLAAGTAHSQYARDEVHVSSPHGSRSRHHRLHPRRRQKHAHGRGQSVRRGRWANASSARVRTSRVRHLRRAHCRRSPKVRPLRRHSRRCILQLRPPWRNPRRPPLIADRPEPDPGRRRAVGAASAVTDRKSVV